MLAAQQHYFFMRGFLVGTPKGGCFDQGLFQKDWFSWLLEILELVVFLCA